MPIAHFTARVLLALALGIMIGVERQWRQRMAGLRTNALVALGASLFSSIATLMASGTNPTQIAAYIVSGTGFLAGAVIFKEDYSVRGLNTAATLWATAAVGTLVGSGFYAEATIGAFAVLGTNVVLRPLVQRINRQPLDPGSHRHFIIRVTCTVSNEPSVRVLLLARIQDTRQLLLQRTETHSLADGNVEIIAFTTSGSGPESDLRRIVGRLSLDNRIFSAQWVPSGMDHTEE